MQCLTNTLHFVRLLLFFSCFFSPSLCQAKSWVKLSLDSQATFQSPVWIPIGCSWFLVWLLLRVLEKVAQPTSMGQRWRVCPQSHFEQDLVWCDSVGICQKTEGGVFHVQLGREGRAVPCSSQPSNVSLKLFGAGMVLGREAPLLNRSSSRQYN